MWREGGRKEGGECEEGRERKRALLLAGENAEGTTRKQEHPTLPHTTPPPPTSLLRGGSPASAFSVLCLSSFVPSLPACLTQHQHHPPFTFIKDHQIQTDKALA